MKLSPITLLFLPFFWALLSGPAYGQTACAFPPQVENEPWDAFWAQHYVGADLLREELEKLRASDEETSGLVAIWDSPIRKHDEQVSQIIAGTRASALIPRSGPFPIYHNPKNVEEFSRDCLQKRNCPLYINHSMDWSSDKFAQLVPLMSSRGSTVVTSAGNGRTAVRSQKNHIARNQRNIVVTSLAPDGRPSIFTSYSDAATIAAPSDNSIRSYDFEGNPTNFGGTSGASPLVTGTLGAFTLLSGYPLETSEARFALAKTAIPLPFLPRSHLLGAGMLNTYKMGMVAQRLKQKCDQLLPELRYNCLYDTIRDESVYRFEEESRQLFVQAQASFPECFGENQNIGMDSCQKAQAFDDFRRAALLNPEDARIWKGLACIKNRFFRSEKSKQTTMFYLSLAERVQQEDGEILADLCRHRPKLAQYLDGPTLSSLMNETECQPELLDNIMWPLFNARADWITDRQALIGKLITHPQMNELTLLKIASQFQNNFQKVEFDSRTIFEHLFTHPLLNEEVLYTLAKYLEFNTQKIPDHQSIFERIFSHPLTASGKGKTVFYSLTRYFEKNAGEIPDHHQVFERIFSHPKLDTHTFRYLASYLERYAEQIPGHRGIFERLFAHRLLSARALASLTKYSMDNLEHTTDPHALVERLFGHPKLDSDTLKHVAREMGKHTTPSSYGQMLERILAHPKFGINHNDFGHMTNIILNNAEHIPEYKIFLNNLLDHDKIRATSLVDITRSLLKNPEVTTIDQAFLERILGHPQSNHNGLKTITELVINNSDKVPNLQRHAQQVLAHPQVAGPRNNRYPVTALRFVAQLAIEHSDRIPDSQIFLNQILIHPKVSTSDLGHIARIIVQNAASVANFQTLLSEILEHASAGANTIEGMGVAIINTGILPEFQDLFDRLVDHQAHNYGTLSKMITRLKRNRDKIANHQEWLNKLELKKDALTKR